MKFSVIFNLTTFDEHFVKVFSLLIPTLFQGGIFHGLQQYQESNKKSSPTPEM